MSLAFIAKADTVRVAVAGNSMIRALAVLAVACLALSVASPARADDRADVQKAFERVIDAGGFRAQANGRLFGPELPSMAGEIEVVFPNRIHASTEDLEFIVTPAGAWLGAFGGWVPTDRSLLPVTAFDPAAMRRAIASIHDVRLEGTAKTSRCPTRVYRFRASGQLPGANTDGDLRVWICEGDGKPARLEAADANGGNRVTVVFDWSQRAVVEAP